jgi:hypothetical protein
MKRLLTFATVVVLTVFASDLLLAQSNSFVGTWRLNSAKTKYTSGAPPKEETVTIQMTDDRDQTSANGIAADGSTFSLKYEVPDKGGTGKVLDGPFDAVSAKRVDDNTIDSTFMKGGKEIRHIHGVVSKDGKTLRVALKGTDAQGKPAAGVLIFEKQ